MKGDRKNEISIFFWEQKESLKYVYGYGEPLFLLLIIIIFFFQ